MPLPDPLNGLKLVTKKQKEIVRPACSYVSSPSAGYLESNPTEVMPSSLTKGMVTDSTPEARSPCEQSFLAPQTLAGVRCGHERVGGDALVLL